jgi:mono/diheme cytochrome c family protein
MAYKIFLILAAGLLLMVACGSPEAPAEPTPDVALARTSAASTVVAQFTVTAAALTPTSSIPRPSNTGGVGKAVDLKGDPAAGKKIYVVHCNICHMGGVANPGSVAGMVPSLNPVDDRLKSSDYKTFASNLDLFIEHGSTPQINPSEGMLLFMPNWGDSGRLSPQQIADVISYIISINE